MNISGSDFVAEQSIQVLFVYTKETKTSNIKGIIDLASQN